MTSSHVYVEKVETIPGSRLVPYWNSPMQLITVRTSTPYGDTTTMRVYDNMPRVTHATGMWKGHDWSSCVGKFCNVDMGPSDLFNGYWVRFISTSDVGF